MAIILSSPPKFFLLGKDNGTAVGWKIYTYGAGTLVNKATYTDATGTTPNTNPIILDARGEADIWWDGTYNVVIKDENDITISTTNNFTAQQEASQWASSISSAYLSATSFTVSGNLTSDYETGRRILLNDSPILYGTVVSSSYSSPNTTVIVSTDSGNVSSSLASTQLSIMTASNNAMPNMSVGSDVASSSALSLGEGSFFDVTGTTAITSIGTKGKGKLVTLQFDGALVLTHNVTSLVLPSGANITTAAKDIGVFYEYSTGNWRCVSYVKYSGEAIVGRGFRGALAYPSTNLTYTTTAKELLWDSEFYDTDNIHDITTNTGRLTVPAGVTKVRLSYNNLITSADASNYSDIRIYKNGSSNYFLESIPYVTGSTPASFSRTTPIINVAAGDYFQLYLAAQAGVMTLTDASPSTSFGMEIIE